jgi:hypothetical protein
LLENPEAAQPLQFIIHVLPAFNPESKAATAAAGSAAVENVLLQPAGAQAIHADGSTGARLEGNTLVLTAFNPGDRMQREIEQLPSWNLAVDMTRRRGLGLWLTGDNSGALVLVELGRRDYVLPIDFNGRRYVEIPNGEVSWASSAWGWRMETKSTDYSKVRSVRIGFGELPPHAKATVKVEQLSALGEIPVTLRNPVVRVGTGQLRVRGVVASGQFLQYTGGDTAIVYDENWHWFAECPVEKADYAMPSGQAGVTVTVEQAGSLPWLEVQFITTGVPIPVGSSGRRTETGFLSLDDPLFCSPAGVSTPEVDNSTLQKPDIITLRRHGRLLGLKWPYPRSISTARVIRLARGEEVRGAV